jgi:hypothetical protein
MTTDDNGSVPAFCVFITAGPITKLFAGGGGGEWTTCAMIDDEPKPVWMSPLVTHGVLVKAACVVKFVSAGCRQYN